MQELTPGELAKRSGVAVSALHFYEREGLIESRRTTGNQRRYARHTLRRVSFIRVSQGLGISLREIRTALDTLPASKAPTKADWTRLSHVGAPTSTHASRRSNDCATISMVASDAGACHCVHARSTTPATSSRPRVRARTGYSVATRLRAT